MASVSRRARRAKHISNARAKTIKKAVNAKRNTTRVLNCNSSVNAVQRPGNGFSLKLIQ